MKKLNILITYSLDIIIIFLIMLTLSPNKIERDTFNVYNNNLNKKVMSHEFLYLYPQKETLENEKEVSNEDLEKVPSFNLDENKNNNSSVSDITNDSKEDNTNNKNDVESIKPDGKEDTIIESFTGTMSGYGPDCYGCTSNRTASGQYIGEGNIYINDATYGTARIIAADKKYPFGTIIRISNSKYHSESIIAMVLDRGGSIGNDKRIQVDLLYAKEADAMGMEKNVKFEVLRLGY